MWRPFLQPLGPPTPQIVVALHRVCSSREGRVAATPPPLTSTMAEFPASCLWRRRHSVTLCRDRWSRRTQAPPAIRAEATPPSQGPKLPRSWSCAVSSGPNSLVHASERVGRRHLPRQARRWCSSSRACRGDTQPPYVEIVGHEGGTPRSWVD